MKIHHLNCGSLCPLGGRFWDGVSRGSFADLCCHCWLIETPTTLVLVDTGLARDESARASPLFRLINRPRVADGRCALTQVERLGFRAADVGHIVLTHLDFDHAGGITDFPNARVHVTEREYRDAHRPPSWIRRERYRKRLLDDRRDWRGYAVDGETWLGFGAVRDLDGLPPEILLVPLEGHTRGHAGVAVQTAAGWRLHAGDAYFYRGEMSPTDPHCLPGPAAYQRFMAEDNARRLANQTRLRELIRTQGREVQVHSSHDPVELAMFQDFEITEAAKRPDGRAATEDWQSLT